MTGSGKYRPVKSTRKSKTPLVWAHTETIEEVVKFLDNDLLWESFSQASEKIFDSPISRSRGESWQLAHGKKRLSDFWKKGKVEAELGRKEVDRKVDSRAITYLLTWNPKRSSWDDIGRMSDTVQNNGVVKVIWS